MIRGTYVLIIDVPVTFTTHIGAKGERTLEKGRYAYVGSAQGGIRQRVTRHLRAKKRHHWHIDYVLDHATIVIIYYMGSEKAEECRLASLLQHHLTAVPGIGASDCRCRSHLFRIRDGERIDELLATRGYERFTERPT